MANTRTLTKAGNQRKSSTVLTSIPGLVLVNNLKCISVVAMENFKWASKEDVGYRIFDSRIFRKSSYG